MASHTLSLLLPMFVVLTLTSLLLISPCDACHDVDKQALLHFKSKITADPSKLIDSWTSSSDCCQDWNGITCDSSTGRVVNLSLIMLGIDGDRDILHKETYLSGTLSPYLGNLTYLQVLELNNLKKLKGPIPEELGNLSELKKLSLVMNEFTGSIPMSFRKLSKLEFLILDGNHLSGNLDSSVIESLKSITQLSLAGNHLSGKIPSSIGSLKFLILLDLQHNRFDGSIPSSIGNLKHLGLLLLSHNQISGKIPESIGNLSQLRYLALAQNEISGNISPLGKLRYLTKLDLSKNRLVGRIPSNMAIMPRSAFEGNARLCGPPLSPCKHF